MNLRSWHDQGVDLDAFLGLTMRQDKKGVLHSGAFCPIGCHDSNVEAFLGLDDELCEECWSQRIPRELVLTMYRLDDIEKRAEKEFALALESGLSSAGFVSFLAALWNLPDPEPEIAPYVASTRRRYMEAFRASFSDRPARQEVLLAEVLGGKEPSGQMALVYYSDRFPTRLRQISSTDAALLAAWWVEDAPVEGFLFRLPLEVAEYLNRTLKRVARDGNEVSLAVLRKLESEETISTAVALLDPTSSILHRIDRALQTARAL